MGLVDKFYNFQSHGFDEWVFELGACLILVIFTLILHGVD